jgi:RNA polymerase sigma-70 factor (ECF subfamily)
MQQPTATVSSPPASSGNTSVAQTGRLPVPPQGDDAALLQRVVAQDVQAFDILYARYVPRLRGYLAHFLHDPALVEEVCHDVMLVVWQQAGRFPITVPLFAWLCGIARHKARKAWARTSSPVKAHAMPEARPPEIPEALLLHQESGRLLLKALDALPYHERTAMLLLMQHGCSYQDIATQLHTPVSTVRTRVWRACHRLRTLVTTLHAAPPPRRPTCVPASHPRRGAHRPLPQVRNT